MPRSSWRLGPVGRSVANGEADAGASAAAALAVEMRHLALVVARAGGRTRRHGGLDALGVGGVELDVQRPERLVQALARARADQRHDVLAARQPASTASAMAPTVSSIGPFGSTRAGR